MKSTEKVRFVDESRRVELIDYGLIPQDELERIANQNAGLFGKQEVQMARELIDWRRSTCADS